MGEACGTGACATTVAAISRFALDREQTIIMDGGSVIVRWDGGEVILTGDATEVFNGKIDIEE